MYINPCLYKFLTILLFGLLGLQNCFSQPAFRNNKLESDLDSLQALIINNPDNTAPVIEKLKKSGNVCLQYYAQYYNGFALYHKSAYSEAKEALALLLIQVKNNEPAFTHDCYSKLIYKIVNLLFFVEKNLGNYNKGLELLEANESFLDPDVLLFLYGTAQMGLGNYEEAIRLFKKDIHEGYIARRIQNSLTKNSYSSVMAQRYNAIGDAYQKLYIRRKQEATLDSASYYYEKAVETIRFTDKIPEYTHALLISRKAKNYALKEDYLAALHLYRKAAGIPIIREKATERQLIDLCMADCFYKLGQADSAIHFVGNFLDTYARTPTTKANLVTAYFILAECYGKQKNTEKAYLFAKKNIELTGEIERTQKEALDFIHNYNIKAIKGQYQSVVQEKNKAFRLLMGFGLLLLALAVAGFISHWRYAQKKYQRFLAIINNLPPIAPLPEPAMLLAEEAELVDVVELPGEKITPKPTLDAESMARIGEGLKKMEKQRWYLRADFKLAFVAKKLNTNTVYLSAYFNNTRKQTFSNYVQELRIQYVLSELRNNPQFRRYSLQAIAEEIGYKNATTFVSVFKKTTGITPVFYIRELNKKDPQSADSE